MVDSSASAPISTCPVCHQDDRTQRVSGLMDSNTSHTGGNANTTGYTVGSQGFSLNESSTKINMTTTSYLIRRFNMPKRPSAFGKVVGVWVVIFLITSFLTVGLDGGIATLICATAATIGAVVFYRSKAGKYRQQQAEWDLSRERLRGGYYCSRDDVAFLPGFEGVTPEAFSSACFASSPSGGDRS